MIWVFVRSSCHSKRGHFDRPLSLILTIKRFDVFCKSLGGVHMKPGDFHTGASSPWFVLWLGIRFHDTTRKYGTGTKSYPREFTPVPAPALIMYKEHTSSVIPVWKLIGEAWLERVEHTQSCFYWFSAVLLRTCSFWFHSGTRLVLGTFSHKQDIKSIFIPSRNSIRYYVNTP